MVRSNVDSATDVVNRALDALAERTVRPRVVVDSEEPDVEVPDQKQEIRRTVTVTEDSSAIKEKGRRGTTAAGPTDNRIIFQRGAFEGMVVDSDERVEQLAKRIFRKVEKGGKTRTMARRSLKVE
jgi:hypothetical protein